MFEKIRRNYEFYKKKYFRGKDLYCPFCSGFYKADKYKLSKEMSSVCPICGSTLEERTVLLFLQAKTTLLSGELKVLVVTEPGKTAEYFSNYPGTEVKIYTETGDLTIRDNTLKNKYPSDHFDIIVCNYILEKLPDYIPVLADLKRILKPDGIIMLQANIDAEKDKTEEFPITSYKDRFMMYGIAGNHRRFGKDYADQIRSKGLNLTRLKFSGGFEILPGLSFDKEEIFYIAHKTDKPALTDNMDELEENMHIQKHNDKGSAVSSFIYTAFFIVPELVRKHFFSLLGNISEREENKGTLVYMIYILLSGQFFYWLGLFLYVIISSISQEMWLVGLVFLFLFGFGGAMIMGGYVFLNYRAGLFKKLIVGMFLLVSLFYPFFGAFF
ncbi:MAG TPA: methyltransferase domain-containing protein [Clostridiales bacterium]|nr:methyltransferase domain-containing protein [Clostridiales bacterium]